MNYTPYFIGFSLGFGIASIFWIWIYTQPGGNTISYASVYCSKQGFNAFTIDQDMNIVCKNIIKSS